jgi:hypothetical protein
MARASSYDLCAVCLLVILFSVLQYFQARNVSSLQETEVEMLALFSRLQTDRDIIPCNAIGMVQGTARMSRESLLIVAEGRSVFAGRPASNASTCT